MSEVTNPAPADVDPNREVFPGVESFSEAIETMRQEGVAVIRGFADPNYCERLIEHLEPGGFVDPQQGDFLPARGTRLVYTGVHTSEQFQVDAYFKDVYLAQSQLLPELVRASELMQAGLFVSHLYKYIDGTSMKVHKDDMDGRHPTQMMLQLQGKATFSVFPDVDQSTRSILTASYDINAGDLILHRGDEFPEGNQMMHVASDFDDRIMLNIYPNRIMDNDIEISDLPDYYN